MGVQKMKLRYITVSAFLLLGGLGVPGPISAPQEGSSKAAKKSGFAVLPYLYYTPETHLAVGGGGIFYFPMTKDETVTRPSNILFSVTFTQKKQYSINFNPDFYLGNGYHLQFDLKYEKFPDKLFGVGNDTPKSLEEPYTPKRWKLRVEGLKKVSKDVNLGFQYFYDRMNLIKVEPGRELATGAITGGAGGVASGGGFFMTLDSRDSIFFPTKGRYHQVSALGFGRALGSDFSYGKFLLDLRQYFGFATNRVLGIQSQILIQPGDPPFWQMGMLGGEKGLRGYYQGRYRDKNLFYLRAEYRWVPIFWRIGMAAFGGFGQVADRLGGFRLDGFKYSYGIGLRGVLSRAQRLHVRFDYARGSGSSAVYFTAGEAF